ncbi:sigma-70 family RNA polymerase sigma factor [Bythopirellula polymerisocia]|uniref:RNA polymerase sigma factor n=1 Tax=Bythopirellula polymerisocia TaxID=2528003 RepID=A0A5C6D0G3_9BACT|nr:sigma-70 family RNA polymerase sigma factor [Bythopirellula polymerisocia]TWU28666.1 RNA polymerase sigma factor [Bythopirellula polymerisocia]
MKDSTAKSGTPNDPQRYELFVKLLLENESSVRAYLRGLLPTWQDVEEVAQEASLVAWRKFSDFEEGTSFGGWFLTIARYEAMSYRRRLARTPLVFSDDVWGLLAAEAAEDEGGQIRRQHLEKCLDKLDAASHELLLKVYSPGVMMREVAKQSGKGEQAFYKVVQRLRSALLKCISKAMALEGIG